MIFEYDPKSTVVPPKGVRHVWRHIEDRSYVLNGLIGTAVLWVVFALNIRWTFFAYCALTSSSMIVTTVLLFSRAIKVAKSCSAARSAPVTFQPSAEEVDRYERTQALREARNEAMVRFIERPSEENGKAFISAAFALREETHSQRAKMMSNLSPAGRLQYDQFFPEDEWSVR